MLHPTHYGFVKWLKASVTRDATCIHHVVHRKYIKITLYFASLPDVKIFCQISRSLENYPN